MCILPDYQRKKIGSKLIFSLFEKEPTTKQILLITKDNNYGAQTFYKTIGFKLSSFQHPDYPKNFIGYEYLK